VTFPEASDYAARPEMKRFFFAITRRQINLSPMRLLFEFAGVFGLQLGLLYFTVTTLNFFQLSPAAFLIVLGSVALVVLIPFFLGSLLILDLMWQVFGVYRILGLRGFAIRDAVRNLVE
jgi:hypothetical protein